MVLRNTIIQTTLVLTLITSCTSYYLTTDSLRNQFSGIDSTKLRNVTVRYPNGIRHSYLANPIDMIDCTDKSGNPSQLANSPSIEMRVTEKNGKRTVFYFDNILVTDSTLYGGQSRFMPGMKKVIKLANIRKIEVQDGKKNFDYVSK
jgi:hypothetical protein